MDRMKRIDPQQYEDDEDEDRRYKSKNLNAERRRRKKLSDRQLELRSLVPIITNMTKATIITDAITYIEELQKSVKGLSDQLLQMESSSGDEDEQEFKKIDVDQEMKNWGLTQEVQVHHICGTKIWIKIIFNKKKGAITKLIEAMSMLGFDLTDTNVTTSQGAVLVTSFAEGVQGGDVPDADKIRRYLMEIIESL